MLKYWILFCHRWSGGKLYASCVRDPWQILQHASHHLCAEITSTASFKDRGFFLPEQSEAISILESRRQSTLHETTYYVL